MKPTASLNLLVSTETQHEDKCTGIIFSSLYILSKQEKSIKSDAMLRKWRVFVHTHIDIK